MVSTDRIDGLSTSVAIKAPVRVATTAAITLSGQQSIDGVNVVANDRVLVKDQADARTNGIYMVQTGLWTRAKDFDGARDVVEGTLIYVVDGNSLGDTYWRCTTVDLVIFGDTDITFGQSVIQQTQISGNTRITPSGTTLSPARTIADHLSQSSLVFHSRDFSDIDHTGLTDSLSAVQKLLNKAGNTTYHTVIYLDAGRIKLGNDVLPVSQIIGDLTINSITYLSPGVVRVGFANSSNLVSAGITNGIATGSSFLTIEGAANDANNGRFTMLSMDNTTNSKNVTISVPSRVDASLNETGLTLTSAANRLRIAGMEPLYYRDNCTLIIYADLYDYINSGLNFTISGYNPQRDPDHPEYKLSTNVHFDWRSGRIVFPTRTLTQSRKGMGVTNTNFWSVRGYRTEGNDAGSFTGQARNSRYGVVTGGGMFSGNTQGEDGWHLSRSCSDINISDMNVLAGDDCISLTIEEAPNVGTYLMERIQISNCNMRTQNNSSFKVFLNSAGAVGGGVIRNISVTGCHFGTHDNTGAGTLVRLSSITGYEESINHVDIIGCTCDNIGNGTGALTSTSVRFDYVSRCRISDCTILDSVRNAMIINGGKNCVVQDNTIGHPGPQTSVTNLTGLTGTSITFQSITTSQIAFSGSPDLSTVGTTFTTITISGASNPNNNGTFVVSAVNNTTKTINFLVSPKYASGSFDETGTYTVYVRKQAGEVLSLAGGDGHIVNGNTFLGSYPDTGGRLIAALNGIIMKTDTTTSQVPINHRITGNHFTGFVAGSVISLSNGQYYMVDNNTGQGNTATVFINEISAALGNGYILNNREFGSTTCTISYIIQKSTTLHTGNIGSNADTVTGSITITSGNTTATINVPNYYTGPTGSSPAIGWIQGFTNSDPIPRNLKLFPKTSYGSAKQEYVTWTGSTSRIFTISLDTNPAADVSWDYVLSTDDF